MRNNLLKLVEARKESINLSEKYIESLEEYIRDEEKKIQQYREEIEETKSEIKKYEEDIEQYTAWAEEPGEQPEPTFDRGGYHFELTDAGTHICHINTGVIVIYTNQNNGGFWAHPAREDGFFMVTFIPNDARKKQKWLNYNGKRFVFNTDNTDPEKFGSAHGTAYFILEAIHQI